MCAVSQNAMDKATEVLLRYEEEMIQPSVRTLRFLARNLQQRNMPVPFDVPAETVFCFKLLFNFI